jgi:hypothetical protein
MGLTALSGEAKTHCQECWRLSIFKLGQIDWMASRSATMEGTSTGHAEYQKISYYDRGTITSPLQTSHVLTR